jgi:hypothetical protein
MVLSPPPPHPRRFYESDRHFHDLAALGELRETGRLVDHLSSGPAEILASDFPPNSFLPNGDLATATTFAPYARIRAYRAAIRRQRLASTAPDLDQVPPRLRLLQRRVKLLSQLLKVEQHLLLLEEKAYLESPSVEVEDEPSAPVEDDGDDEAAPAPAALSSFLAEGGPTARDRYTFLQEQKKKAKAFPPQDSRE